VQFRVLGPVEVEAADGRVLAPARRRERCLLAVLLLEVERVVPLERLIDLLWEQDPPDRARRDLYGHVARLRALLADAAGDGQGATLVSHGGGYLIRAQPATVDVHRFGCLVEQASRATDLSRRAELLRDALGLWRGPALHNAATGRIRDRLCAQLDEQRLHATEESLATGLALGRHRELVCEIARLADAHPLRDRLVGLHMLALYHAGRTAESLTVYHTARVTRAEDLGLDPAPGLQLLHQAILRGGPVPLSDLAVDEPAPPTTPLLPAQLPRETTGFTGRDRELKTLDDLASRVHDQPATVVVSAIDGTAGVGKTALVLHWAHRIRDRFPDGQLYLNLRGYAPSAPMPALDALTHLLHALGVPAEQIPTQVERATGMYRSLMADKRMLVILDNAHDPDQVRTLLPGTATATVVITSRNRLGGLVAIEGAHRITLDVLTPDEARTLLRNVLGEARVRAEPDAVTALIESCDRLPLALRIAAANIADGPDRPLADYVTRFATGRLSALQIDDDDQAAVRTAFGLSYTSLPVPVRRLFRLLGLMPGTDITVHAAAVLAGVTPDDAQPLLDALDEAHLVHQHAPRRYTSHDLLRAYAAERADDEDSRSDRRAALCRLYDYYLRTVDEAAQLVYPHILRLPPTAPQTDRAEPVFPDRAEALAWLDTERANLVAAVTNPADSLPASATWRLADALRGYFVIRMHINEGLVTTQAGLAAAEVDGHPRGQAAAHLGLATLHWRQGEYPQAIRHHTRALALARRAGWREAQGAVLGNLGAVHCEQGRPAEGAEHFDRALTLHRQTGRRTGQATALANLGTVSIELGRLAQAADYLVQSIAIHRQLGSQLGEANAMTALGETHHLLGRFDDAIRELTAALDLHRKLGSRGNEADTLTRLAAVHDDAGRHQHAIELATAALALAREAGHRPYEAEALHTLATIHCHLGPGENAVDLQQRAKRLADDIGKPYIQAKALIGLSTAYHQLHQHDPAVDHAENALAMTREAGYRILEGEAHTSLAAITLGQHQPRRALGHAAQALPIHHETGHRLAQARTHLLLSQALSRIGQSNDARAHERTSSQLFAEIGAPATPASGAGATTHGA
jgi:DNA-binding SARP family transcriptional activator/tetratricopeptide (TPR) repeat protein